MSDEYFDYLSSAASEEAFTAALAALGDVGLVPANVLGPMQGIPGQSYVIRR